MSDNLITTVVGTPSAPTTGYTIVEAYLEKKYLAEREFNTPLVQSPYFSQMNQPERVGTHVKFTRRQKIRLPELAKEATDPLSGFNVAYDQILAPMEFINDYAGISVQASLMSWMDLARDAKELSYEAIRRYHNRSIQAAFLMGRAKAGYRNSSGLTTGSATYPHFWTEAEASLSLYNLTFTFQTAPSFFPAGKQQFSDLAADDYATMDDFRRARTRLKNSGARPVDKSGKYVAVISDSIKADLEKDDEYFQAAIRNQEGSKKLFDGELADYAGMHWVLDDEPWTLALGGNGVTLDSDGVCHVCQIFGQDSFGTLRLGGKNSVSPKFKVQDISITGNKMTIGYLLPGQQLVLNPLWCCNFICVVREPGKNEN